MLGAVGGRLRPVASAAAAARTPARSLGDLYGILGVPRDASQGEIKKAYYDRSKELHPDHNQNDEEASKRFARVNEAYSVLSNDASKREYDSALGSGRRYTASAAAAGTAATGGSMRNTRKDGPLNYQTQYDFEEFYRQHYGDALRRERARRQARKEFESQMQNASRGNPALTACVAIMALVLISRMAGV